MPDSVLKIFESNLVFFGPTLIQHPKVALGYPLQTWSLFQGAFGDQTVPFGVKWCILVPGSEPTFGVLELHLVSPRGDFYQPLCVYMVGSYCLVWLVIFNYFGGTLLRQLKMGPF